MPKPKKRKVEVFTFDGECECMVCRTVGGGANERLPVCTRCQTVTPAEFFQLPAAQKKRAAVFLGLVVGFNLLAKALRPDPRRKRRG